MSYAGIKLMCIHALVKEYAFVNYVEYEFNLF